MSTIEVVSAREQAQDKVVDYLHAWETVRVLGTELVPMPRGGYVRTVTFGKPLQFTASLILWSPNRLTLRISGRTDEVVFASVDEFKWFCFHGLGGPNPLVGADAETVLDEVATLNEEILTLRDEVARLSAENSKLRSTIRKAYEDTFGS